MPNKSTRHSRKGVITDRDGASHSRSGLSADEPTRMNLIASGSLTIRVDYMP